LFCGNVHYAWNVLLQVSWASNGDAVFHDICWKAVLDSLKMDNPFCFSDMEKNVLLEAKATAEYFDSSEKLDREALLIARLLKSAKYAVAFTGSLFILFIMTLLSERRMNSVHEPNASS
jgi:hypothetical protein